MWNAAIMISYRLPVPGREGKAMEVFADALTLFGKLAADNKCAEPEVFHHLSGGGMFVVKTESIEMAYEILDLDDVSKVIDVAVFTVSDFAIEVMITGGKLMGNMSQYTAIGTELGYI
jgi:hypothetical protein